MSEAALASGRFKMPDRKTLLHHGIDSVLTNMTELATGTHAAAGNVGLKEHTMCNSGAKSATKLTIHLLEAQIG